MSRKILTNNVINQLKRLLKYPVEVCGIIKDDNVIVDNHGTKIGKRQVCYFKRYSKYIFHTHPLSSKSYPSAEDILKIVKHKRIHYSIISTNWGIWILHSTKKVVLSDKWIERLKYTLNNILTPLYYKTEKGRGDYKNDYDLLISKVIRNIKNELNKRSNIRTGIEIYFQPWKKEKNNFRFSDSISIILKWKEKDFIQRLKIIFPSYNPERDLDNDVAIFLVLLSLMGYKVGERLHLQHVSNKKISKDMLNIIKEAMKYYHIIGLSILAGLLFIVLCRIAKDDNNLKNNLEYRKIEDNMRTRMVTRSMKRRKKEKSCDIKGLRNVSNSCYIDSIFIALFANKNKIIDNFFSTLQNDSIQKEILRIRDSIQGRGNVITCTNFRRKLSQLDYQYDFHTKRMQDAGEFLMFLFSIFRVESTIKKRSTIVYNNKREKIKVSEQRMVDSPIISISPFFLSDESSLEDYIHQKDTVKLSNENRFRHYGQLYKYRTECNDIVYSTFLVFYIQRLMGDDERDYSSIDIPEVLDVEPKELQLSSIIIHQDMHYTCYFRCEKTWYYYDDLDNTITLVGSFENLIDSEPSPNIYGNIYMYI